jgi:hypothetical protein
MRRWPAFALLTVGLAAIDSAAAVGLHEQPSASVAALFARGAACTLAGYALTQAPTDALVAALLATLASFLSLALSDAIILFFGAARYLVPGFGSGHPVFTLLGVPALASAAGSFLALTLARQTAPQRK